MHKFFFYSILFLSFLFPVKVFSFSISPSSLEIDSVHVDVPVTQELILGKLIDEDLQIRVDVKGSGAEFIKLSEEEFTILKDQKRYEYAFTIDAQNAEVGDYEAELHFITQKKKVVEQGVEVKLGLATKVLFSVTRDQIRNVSIKKVRTVIEEKNSIVRTTLQNSGNVFEKLRDMEISIYDDKGELIIIEHVNRDEDIPPLSFHTFDIELDTILAPGRYYVQVVYNLDDKKLEKNNIALNIEEGSETLPVQHGDTDKKEQQSVGYGQVWGSIYVRAGVVLFAIMLIAVSYFLVTINR